MPQGCPFSTSGSALVASIWLRGLRSLGIAASGRALADDVVVETEAAGLWGGRDAYHRRARALEYTFCFIESVGAKLAEAQSMTAASSGQHGSHFKSCLLYTSPSPRD
eukprot:3386947-Alexandrium_andersonii.AAC.1